MKFKEGQTYICIKSDRRWWTVDKEYNVVLNDDNKPVLLDDEGDMWYSNDLIGPNNNFKLKETMVTYTQLEVQQIILNAYQTYEDDSQRLAFIKRYFSK